jgi:putative Mg2+ transporter-C (MgtC) family protein
MIKIPMELVNVVLRLLITFILALLFGLERQRSHKPIGFGTFIFVSIGSCSLALTAIELGVGNPLPLLGSIVTGIGFLGAGALIKTTDKIFGFTTAASIWVFAILGLLIGVGHYYSGFITYSFVWVVILIDSYLEKNGSGSYQKRILVTIKRNEEKKLEELLKNFNKVKMISIEVDKNKKIETYCYLINCGGKKLRRIVNILNQSSWIIEFKIE